MLSVISKLIVSPGWKYPVLTTVRRLPITSRGISEVHSLKLSVVIVNLNSKSSYCFEDGEIEIVKSSEDTVSPEVILG